MKLKEYLEDKNKAEFARSCRISRQYLWEIVMGNIKNPGIRVCEAIEKASSNMVTRYDLCEDALRIWGPIPQ